MDSPTANLLSILTDRVEAHRAAGDLQEALHAASAAVEKAQHTLGPNLESIDAFVATLEIRGDLYRELGNFDLACDDYRQGIDQLQDRADQLALIGRLHAGFGAAHDALGHSDKAAQHWESAIWFFEQHEPPLTLDVATMANNLGFLYKAAGEFDAAETYFLRALEILHAQLGQNDEQTATVSSNLGALYQASGFNEQAREMHMIALETRLRLCGANHPDTAQSYNNLALTLRDAGDFSSADSYFETALTAFVALGPEYADDLESVVSNYYDFLIEQGEEQRAKDVLERVKDLVDVSIVAS